MTLLTLDEVAKLGRVSRRTVEREIDRGNLKILRIGASIRVREVEVDRWLDSRSDTGSTLRGTQPKED